MVNCICSDIAPGTEELMMTNDVYNDDGSVREGQEIGWGIKRDTEGNHFLSIYYYDGERMASKIIDCMQFCPHCGRPLQNNHVKHRLGNIR